MNRKEVRKCRVLVFLPRTSPEDNPNFPSSVVAILKCNCAPVLLLSACFSRGWKSTPCFALRLKERTNVTCHQPQQLCTTVQGIHMHFVFSLDGARLQLMMHSPQLNTQVSGCERAPWTQKKPKATKVTIEAILPKLEDIFCLFCYLIKSARTHVGAPNGIGKQKPGLDRVAHRQSRTEERGVPCASRLLKEEMERASSIPSHNPCSRTVPRGRSSTRLQKIH